MTATSGPKPKKTHKDQSVRRVPAQRRSRERVDRILDAALDLLSDGAKASTTAIAERTGLPVGTIYQFFPNLDSILTEALRRMIKRITDDMQQILQRPRTGDPLHWEETIDLMVDEGASYFAAQKGYRHLLRALQYSDEAFDILSEGRQTQARQTADRFEAAGLAPEDAAMMARVLLEASLALTTLALTSRDDQFRQRVLEENKILLKAYVRERFIGLIGTNDDGDARAIVK